MGNQCVRDAGSDDEADDKAKNKDKPTKKPAPSSSKKGSKYDAVSKITALQHAEKPSQKICDVQLYEPNFREFSRIFTSGEAALSIASCDDYEPGSQQMLAAGEDRTMALLNFETGHIIQHWKQAHDRDINVITRPMKGSGVFATCSRDKMIRLWKLRQNDAVHTLRGHELNVTSVTTSTDGRLLASGSRDNSVRLWDIERGTQLASQDVKLNIVHFVRWIEPMQCVAQGGEDLTIRLWDVRMDPDSAPAMELAQTFGGFDYHPLCCDGLSNDPDRGHVLYTGHNGFNNQGSMISEWDLRKGAADRHFLGHGFSVRSVKLLRGEAKQNVGLAGNLLSASDDGTLRLWDRSLPADTEQEKLTRATCSLSEGNATSIDETSDGNILLALRSGCLMVLKPKKNADGTIKPFQRYRYVGCPSEPSKEHPHDDQ